MCIVAGDHFDTSVQKIRDLYQNSATHIGALLVMDVRSAEMTKYAVHALLAARTSTINEIASICAAVNVDVVSVCRGLGVDARIADLQPGLGYGGPSLPKDVRALCETAREAGYEARLLLAVEQVNRDRHECIADCVLVRFATRPLGLTVAVWGLAYQVNTADARDSPALATIRKLLANDIQVVAYDPAAMVSAQEAVGDVEGFSVVDDPYGALEGADALAVLTPWPAFQTPDFARMTRLMARAVLFDGHNFYQPDQVRAAGFEYIALSRKSSE